MYRSGAVLYGKDSPLMASPSMGNIGGCAWCDDSFRGAWCKYDVVSGLVGYAVMLSELVGFSYSLVCYNLFSGVELSMRLFFVIV